MCHEQSGYYQGIYQWETKQNAENYSRSFTVRFMTSRTEPNSVSYKVIPNKNIYNYLEKIISTNQYNTRFGYNKTVQADSLYLINKT